MRRDHDTATAKLGWQRFSTTGRGEIHRSEVKARNGKDALFMEVHDKGLMLVSKYDATAYYWLEDSQRGIRLYDDRFSSFGEARTALTQWYLNHASTLLVTLAG